MIIRNLTVVLIALVVPLPSMANEKPTRSECIVGYALDWSQVKTDPHDVRGAMFYWRPRHNDAQELASMSLRPDGSRLYLQFRNRCEEKEHIAADLIGFWQSKGLDLPTFELLPGPIAPSPDTIDRQGPYWSDPATLLPKHQENPTDI